METEISKSQFEARVLEIFRRVEMTGESVVVTDHGTPSVVVRKYVAPRTCVRDRLKGSVLRFEAPFEPVADDAWEALG
ncbi:MAG: type II toxin-antitoxin system Phd/YefM family antitoxin [Proteobacteria bacterium]|nr:type II toxin-antitoxin system Phd/YefM family antitoxin [Pseudomonadota bacterium]